MSSPPRRPLRTLQLLRQPVLLVWACYVAMTPFYLVKAGLPQPGDALIILLVPMALATWNGRMPRTSARAVRPLLWFTFWVCLVSIAWAFILWAWAFNLLYPLYYLYNTAFFFAALVLYQRYGDAFLRLTVVLVLATVIFQVAASVVLVGGFGRNRLFFHNPNQLGYYALLAACIIAVAQRRLGISLMRTSLGLVACAYLALLSSSRSAIAGIGFLIVLLVFANPRVLLLAAIASISLMIIDTPIDQSVETLQTRFSENRNPNHTFFEQRGYDRLWANKEHLLFGAAEGNMWRWTETTKLGAAEIHSSAGTLLFCYGLPGVFLFGAFLYQVIRGVRIRSALMLLPPLLYSIAHQGLRFTMLWVLLALFVALKGSDPEGI